MSEIPEFPAGKKAGFVSKKAWEKIAAAAGQDVVPDPSYFDVFTKDGVKFFRPRATTSRDQQAAAAKSRRFGFWTDGKQLYVRRGVVTYANDDPPISTEQDYTGLPDGRYLTQVIPTLNGVELAEEGTAVGLPASGSLWLVTRIQLCSGGGQGDDRVELLGLGAKPEKKLNEQSQLIGKFTREGTEGNYGLKDVEYWLQSDVTVSYNCNRDGGTDGDPSQTNSPTSSPITSSSISGIGIGDGDKGDSSPSPVEDNCAKFEVDCFNCEFLCFDGTVIDGNCRGFAINLKFRFKVAIAAAAFGRCNNWNAWLTCDDATGVVSAVNAYANDPTHQATGNTVCMPMSKSQDWCDVIFSFSGADVDSIACKKINFSGKINNAGRDESDTNPKVSKCCNTTDITGYGSASAMPPKKYPKEAYRNMPSICPPRCGCSSGTPTPS